MDSALAPIVFTAHTNKFGGQDVVCLHLMGYWDRRVPKIALRNRSAAGFDRYIELAEERKDITVEEVSFFEEAELRQWLLRRRVPKGVAQWVGRLSRPAVIGWTALSFARRFRRLRPAAVISASDYYPGGPLTVAPLVGAWLAAVPRRVFLSHSFATKCSWPFRFYDYLMDKLVARTATHVVTVSQACAHQIGTSRALGCSIKVILNGIPVDTSKDYPPDQARTVLQVSQEDLVVGVLGHVEERKGQEIAVKAMPLVLQKEPRVRLVLVGLENSEYGAMVRTLAREVGVEHAVKFIGYIPHAERLLSGIDLLVVPSVRLESFGLVVLEAMARDKPVIVSDTGGLTEIVEDGETGLVYPSRDPEALADQIIKILRDRTLGRRLSEAAIVTLHARFTVARMVNEYQELVASID